MATAAVSQPEHGVTAFAALMSRDDLGRAPVSRAVDWLMGQTGQETLFVYELRNELLAMSQVRLKGEPDGPSFRAPRHLEIFPLPSAFSLREGAAVSVRKRHRAAN